MNGVLKFWQSFTTKKYAFPLILSRFKGKKNKQTTPKNSRCQFCTVKQEGVLNHHNSKHCLGQSWFRANKQLQTSPCGGKTPICVFGDRLFYWIKKGRVKTRFLWQSKIRATSKGSKALWVWVPYKMLMDGDLILTPLSVFALSKLVCLFFLKVADIYTTFQLFMYV